MSTGAATNQGDERSNARLIRQWERLNTIRNQLTKMGLANGDTPPVELMRILRREIPADLFAKD